MIIESFLTFINKILFFTSYVNNGNNSFPRPLDLETEKLHMERAKQGDRESKDILIRHNLRLVAHIVKKYNNAAEVDDLISIGSIGLIKAINSFQYGKGTQFATYAAKCIDNEILMHIRANRKHRPNASLMDTVGTDREGNEISLIDLLAVKEESVFERVEFEMMSEKLRNLIKASLEPRDFKIICQRYGLFGEEPLTQREVASKQNISRSYVSRLEKKALRIIRIQMEKNDLLF